MYEIREAALVRNDLEDIIHPSRIVITTITNFHVKKLSFEILYFLFYLQYSIR